MKKLFIVLLALGFVQVLCAQTQVNFQLKGHRGYGDTCLSNIWGYAANGREYALVGTCEGLSIVDITTPSAAVEVAMVPGAHSIWREIKTWNHYAYVVTEGGGGLTIVNLEDLPNGNVPYTHYQLTPDDTITNAHTIFIDEKGICFLFGASGFLSGQGYVALDLNVDPENPQYLGRFGDFYIHDAFVRGDTMYAGAILDGYAAIMNVSDIQNPVVYSTTYTPGYFTHNVWPNRDASIMYTTDEVSSAYVAAYDISDPTFPVFKGAVRSRPGSQAIPHNVHVVNNDWLAVSYYTQGVVLIDAHRPTNPVITGYFDTYPFGNGNGFMGNWGVYPYLPSGNWILSDINTGLWIVRPTFQRAAYLEGTVADSTDGSPISGAQVSVDYPFGFDTARTYLDGSFTSGVLQSGQFNVHYSAPGYITKTELLTFIPSFVTTRHVKLLRSPTFGQDEAELPAFNLFPNPVSDYLNIDGLQGDIAWKIFRMDGSLYRTGLGSSISVQSLVPGAYVIELENQGSRARRVFVKE